jgi:hypothetical protein
MSSVSRERWRLALVRDIQHREDVLTCLYFIRGRLEFLQRRVAALLDQIQMEQSSDTILPR